VRGERLHAAVLDQGGDAAVTGEALAWWYGLGGFSPRNITLVTTSTGRWKTALGDVNQVRTLPDRWVTLVDDLRVVRPELMLVHLAGTIHPKRLGRTLDNAWREGLLSGRSIDLLLADLGRSGRNGIGLLRELRAERAGDYVPPDSNLEHRATEVLKPLRLTLDRQVNSGGEQWSGRVDLRDRFLPLVIEVQSAKYHSALLDRVADDARRAQLERDGFTVVEITDHELWTDPDAARHRVADEVRRLRRAAS
jgi:very-short-patch-repair endonuclease